MPVRPLSEKELAEIIARGELTRSRASRNNPGLDPTEEEALISQIQGQEEKLAQLGGEKPKKKKGILERGFDVLSRPVYASANAFKSLITDEDKSAGETIGDFFKEGWEGLSGKDKTTFSDVIEEAGVTGDSLTDKLIRGAGGFALDVALDPTTYVTLGTSAAAKGTLRGGLEVAQATSAGRKAAQVMRAGDASVAKKVSEKMLDDFVAKGLDDTVTTLTKAEGEKLSHKFLQDSAYEAAQREAGNVAANAKRTFDLRFAGRPVVQSERLYDLGTKVNKTFKSTELGQGLSRTFSTRHKLPGEIHTFHREAEGFSHAQFEEFTKSVRNAFRGVSKEDKRLISDAIERGQKLDGKLGELQQKAIDFNDSITQIELGRGILNEEDMLQNYLYHFYRGTDRDAVKKFKSERAKVQNPTKLASANKTKKGQPTLLGMEDWVDETYGGSKVTVKSLEEADRLGLKPVREIDDLLILRGGKSFSEQSRAQFADMIRMEFGVKLGSKEKQLADKLGLVQAKSKYLKDPDLYIPPEVDNAVKYLDELHNNPQSANNLLRMFDKNLANLKFLQTAANPGHHIRNAVGDMFLNVLDGVTNPLRYSQAVKVLDPTIKTTIKVGDGFLTGEQIRNLYKLKGGKAGYTRAEIGVRKIGAAEKIREFAEAREDWTRMAHFIDALKKEGGSIKGVGSVKSMKQLESAASKAAARVRKWNLDYSDLTPAEKAVFRRVAPFYTWMRKNIPLQLEALALRPGRQAVVPKSLRALQEVLGTDGDYPTIGGLDTVPQWLRDMAGVRISGEGEGKNGIYFDPSVIVPAIDPMRIVGDPLMALAEGDPKAAIGSVSKEILNQTNPAIRGAIEFGTGRNVFTGAELDKNPLEYALETIPAGRLGSRGLSGENRPTDIVNYLTGTSLRPVEEPQRMSEYRRQQDSIESALRAATARSVGDTYGISEDDPAFADRVDELNNELNTLMRQRKRAAILQRLEQFSASTYTQNQDYYR